jgi:hypothetical protein
MHKDKSKELLEAFQKVGQGPVYWQLIARELICAANTLFARYRTIEPVPSKVSWPPPPLDLNRFHTSGRPILFLYGLAVENLIKAILVAKGNDTTSTGLLNKKVKHHRLVQLFREASVVISKDTENLLNKLQWFVEAGKYPVGTKPGPEIDDFLTSSNLEDIWHLLEELERILKERSQTFTLPRTDMKCLCTSSNPLFLKA